MAAPRTTITASLGIALLACACLAAAGARAQESKQAAASPAAGAGDVARGLELFKRGEYDAAVKALRAATKRDKADADAWHYLGLALVRQHKPKDARKAFENAVRLRPNFIPALNGLAYVLISQNVLDEATRAAEASLKVEPKNAETHYLLGAIYLRVDSFNRALAEAEESLKIDPSYAHALWLKTQGLVGMAGKEISTAADETPEVRALLLKAVAARLDEATAALDKFSKLNPQNPEAASLAEQIATMRLYGGTHDAAAGDGRTIFTPREVTVRAVILKRPEPAYTQIARESGTTGTVRLRMVLASDGVVKNIFAVRRLPDGLTEKAIEAARRIKFVPAMKDGRPVSQYVTIDYNFNIY
jgi:TonB family protein